MFNTILTTLCDGWGVVDYLNVYFPTIHLLFQVCPSFAHPVNKQGRECQDLQVTITHQAS